MTNGFPPMPVADDATLKDEPPTPRGRRVRRILNAGTLLIGSLWLIGQVARDWSWLTGVCFYVPSPAVVGLGLVTTFVHLIARDRRRALALGLLTLAPTSLVLFVENQWIRPVRVPAASPGERIRMVHWNIGYGRWGMAGVERTLVEQRASLYILSEVPFTYELEPLAARLGSGFETVRMGTMAVIARGRLLDPTRLVDEYGLRVNAMRWEHGGRTIQVFVVDQTSDLRYARDPLLRRVRSLMVEHRPDLLAGDLNAPRRSRVLTSLPGGFSHAYDVAGQGWSYTWPALCPLYAIDQCLLSRKINPIAYELITSRFSDHRIQALDFAVAGTSERRSGPSS